MSPDKGVVEAITAVRGARGRLVIASKVREPAEQEFFRQRVAPLLGDDVTFVGEVSARERDQLVGAASALVNPIQWNEPFGLVMIEALACGTPVVALDRGSVREIVDHGVTGYVCRDHDDLVDALGSVGRLDRRAARAAAAARFSTEQMVAGYLDLFAATLDRRGAMTVFG
jgi:glycosyltransferase involved in cell wall biosynthesis